MERLGDLLWAKLRHLLKIFLLVKVADNYGVMAYAVFLFTLTIWWGLHWGDATACPYIHFEDCINGSMPVLEVVVRTVAEVFGGVAVFKYVQLLWAMEFAETHIGRAHSAAFDKCSADLQVVKALVYFSGKARL